MQSVHLFDFDLSRIKRNDGGGERQKRPKVGWSPVTDVCLYSCCTFHIEIENSVINCKQEKYATVYDISTGTISHILLSEGYLSLIMINNLISIMCEFMSK